MLDSLDLTPRGVTKFVVKTAIAAKVAVSTANAIDDNTRYDKDNFLVGTAGTCVGAIVAEKLQPFSDKAVDYVADFITAQRVKYQNEKDENSTAEQA